MAIKKKKPQQGQFWPSLAKPDRAFIAPESLNLDENELRKLAAYELAREATRRGQCCPITAMRLRLIFPDWFPCEAYLSIPESVRDSANWEEHNDLFQSNWRGLHFSIRYGLSESAFQNAFDPADLINGLIIDAAALEEETAKTEETGKAGKAIKSITARLRTLNRMLFGNSTAPNPEEIDRSKVYPRLEIDLDFPDTVLVEEFRNLLSQARAGQGGDYKPTYRFPNFDVKALLGKLAATRLWDHHETVQKAMDALFQENLNGPYSKLEANWSKARTEIRELCEAGGRLPYIQDPGKISAERIPRKRMFSGNGQVSLIAPRFATCQDRVSGQQSFPMATTLQQVHQALGTDKFTVLAVAVDQALEARNRDVSLDEQIETLDVQELAGNYGTSFETLRKQISDVVGAGAVFKLGKKWIIRKQTLLQFLQARERSVAE